MVAVHQFRFFALFVFSRFGHKQQFESTITFHNFLCMFLFFFSPIWFNYAFPPPPAIVNREIERVS